MRKITFNLILFLFIFTNLLIFSSDYTTTAESISWNGANTSVAEGFEAMLYNPAGIYMSDRRFGINLLGSYGFKFYNNTFSTNDIIKALQISESDNTDITNLINTKLDSMPDYGMDSGFSFRNVSLMTFIRFSNFSIAFSLINKMDSNIVLSKSIFETVLQNLSLETPLNASIKSTSLLYTDFNTSLSTRVKFLERIIPVDSIFAGIGTHIYIPLLYTVFETSLTFETVDPDPLTGLYSYHANVNGKVTQAGNTGFMQLSKTAMSNAPSELPDVIKTLFSSDGSVGFGVGFDLGIIVKINNFFNVGLAATDIGFFVFPESSTSELNFDVTINPTRFQEFAKDLGSGLQNNIKSESEKNLTPTFFIPDTAIRSGVGFTPLKNKNLDLTLALDLSVSNFNKLLVEEYVTFNFSTGLEIKPKTGWFEFPIRTAFNYNSLANVASISLGTGLHVGPLKLIFGVKGLEILITGWGAKEFAMGFDFNFEF